MIKILIHNQYFLLDISGDYLRLSALHNEPYKQKQLLVCSYNHHKKYTATHLEIIIKAPHELNTINDNIILTDNFNVEPEEFEMAKFLSIYNSKNIF